MPPKLADAEEKVVRELMAQDRKIDAIKLYREKTGIGLAEAKEAVEKLEKGVGGDVAAPGDVTVILNHLRNREKIKAVTAYRDQHGGGLKEARLAVEQLGRQHSIRPQNAGCLGLWLLLAAGVGAVAVRLLI